MKILVTGASGFIGRRVCALAGEAGMEVVALIRPGTRKSGFPHGEIVHGSLPFDVPSAAWRKVGAVIHCAAATTGQGSAESKAINVEGTRHLVEQAVARGGVSRFVFISSQSAHEGAISSYGRTKFAAEEIVRQSGLPYAILRPGLVFGSGQQGLFHRMRKSVRSLPVLPLINGGRTPVQPIDVDDLCEAIIKCLSLPEDESVELNLGEPNAMTLREFMQAVAMAESGRRKPWISIPLAPIKAVVAVAEKMRMPLLISSDNLAGMEAICVMDTEPSLVRIGLHLKPFREAMQNAVREPKSSDASSVLRILLVGAGKIGIVHALNLMHREGETLCGVVDNNPGAFKLYQSMGFETAYHTDLESAIRMSRPDGVIIATPASTHPELTRICVGHGLPVLVEKPAAADRTGLKSLMQLRAQQPDAIIHAGYMAAQYPHLDQLMNLMAAGRFGAVRRFHAFCLQSHIMAPVPVRWETIKSQSGGGVLINFAGHVIAILGRLFGRPDEYGAAAWPIHSAEVEDAIEVRLRYGAVQGRLFACWSAPGYARPIYQIVIQLDDAELVMENYCLSLRRNGRTEQVWTQQDFDAGFNAAPDYTGAGFSREHANFTGAIRAKGSRLSMRETAYRPSGMAVTIQEAVDVETLIFNLYDCTAKQDARSPQWGGGLSSDEVNEHDRNMDQLMMGLRR
ncbi:MAG: Gfo/Idh/MocA family oxidoreductase [bacterium]